MKIISVPKKLNVNDLIILLSELPSTANIKMHEIKFEGLCQDKFMLIKSISTDEPAGSDATIGATLATNVLMEYADGISDAVVDDAIYPINKVPKGSTQYNKYTVGKLLSGLKLLDSNLRFFCYDSNLIFNQIGVTYDELTDTVSLDATY